ncbi:uncharacterized protein LOC135499249 [Lineus longissimus]|uniref:uncharacterized protein LOC135499249 n=1 Tax=Lineus longissimus TaxID=88925 RepID=UPI00315D36E0
MCVSGVLALALAVNYCSGAVVLTPERKDVLSSLSNAAISTLSSSLPYLQSVVQDSGKFIGSAVATVLSFVSDHDGDINIPNYGYVNYHLDACTLSLGKREEKRWLGSVWNTISDVVDTVVDTVVPERKCKARVSDPLTGLSRSATKGSPEDALKSALTGLFEDIVKLAQQVQG